MTCPVRKEGMSSDSAEPELPDASVPPRDPDPACECCGETGEDVNWVVDPYVEAMSREEEWKWMCRRCETVAIMDT